MLRNLFRKILSFYSYIIPAFVLAACLLVYPLGLFGRLSYESKSLDKGVVSILSLTGNASVSGIFTPAHDELESLSFFLLTREQIPDAEIRLTVYDDGGQEIGSYALASNELSNNRPAVFPLKLKLEAGRKYRYELRAPGYPEDTLTVRAGSPAIGPSESEAFFYNGAVMETLTPQIIYTYLDRADSGLFWVYDALILLAGILLLAAYRKFAPPMGEPSHE